jgi:hypothetical protein
MRQSRKDFTYQSSVVDKHVNGNTPRQDGLRGIFCCSETVQVEQEELDRRVGRFGQYHLSSFRQSVMNIYGSWLVQLTCDHCDL